MAQRGIEMRRDDICLYLNSMDRARLEEIVADRNSLRKWAWRVEIVLATADGLGTSAIMRRLASRSRASGAGRKAISMRACLACCATRRDPRAFTAFGREEAGHHREDGNQKTRPRYALERAQDGKGCRRQSSQRAASMAGLVLSRIWCALFSVEQPKLAAKVVDV